MSGKRTKKQKQIAELKRQLQKMQSDQPLERLVSPATRPPPPTIPPTTMKAKPVIEMTAKPSPTTNIFYYDPGLIKKDLHKTLLLTSFLLTVLGITYWLLEKGGLAYIQRFF
jgi:hypothetical protein